MSKLWPVTLGSAYNVGGCRISQRGRQPIIYLIFSWNMFLPSKHFVKTAWKCRNSVYYKLTEEWTIQCNKLFPLKNFNGRRMDEASKSKTNVFAENILFPTALFCYRKKLIHWIPLQPMLVLTLHRNVLVLLKISWRAHIVIFFHRHCSFISQTLNCRIM